MAILRGLSREKPVISVFWLVLGRGGKGVTGGFSGPGGTPYGVPLSPIGSQLDTVRKTKPSFRASPFARPSKLHQAPVRTVLPPPGPCLFSRRGSSLGTRGTKETLLGRQGPILMGLPSIKLVFSVFWPLSWVKRYCPPKALLSGKLGMRASSVPMRVSV